MTNTDEKVGRVFFSELPAPDFCRTVRHFNFKKPAVNLITIRLDTDTDAILYNEAPEIKETTYPICQECANEMRSDLAFDNSQEN